MPNPEGYSQISDRFGFRAVGNFRCTRKSEAVMLAAVAVVYVVALVIIIWNAVLVLSTDYSEKVLIYASSTVNGIVMFVSVFAMIPIITIIAVIAVRIITRGVEYSYTANDEMLIITDPKGKKTSFYYCDMESVTYEKLTLFLERQRGFDVYVKTKYRTFRYQYIYSKNKLLRGEKDTPFFILEEKAGLRERRYSDRMGCE